MAYTPTEWKSGDVITAEKLNNLEGNRVLIVHDTNDPSLEFQELDITPREAIEAVSNNIYIVYQYMHSNNHRANFVPLTSIVLEVGEDAFNQYEIRFAGGQNNVYFTSGNLDMPYSEPDE